MAPDGALLQFYLTSLEKQDLGFSDGAVVRNLPASAEDAGLIPGSGRSGGGNGSPLQYSCLGNPTDRGAWWATVHGVKELDTTEGLTPL